MTIHRRKFLHTALGVAAAILVVPLKVFAARPKAAFGAEKYDDVMNTLYNSTTTDSSHVSIKAPDIAENGAVVPITVKTDLANAESVSIIVPNNPNPLAASFELTPSSGGLVSTRIKMAKTSDVHAVVKAGGKLYSASKEVKVTIGGCGG
ncbi:MAG: thiosulfate oxidation carrier protein SoxY [Gammaproteobacteria bacterium]